MHFNVTRHPTGMWSAQQIVEACPGDTLYHEDRTHLGLGKETPAGRSVSEKPENGKVVAFPRLGGLHHRYEWKDAA